MKSTNTHVRSVFLVNELSRYGTDCLKILLILDILHALKYVSFMFYVYFLFDCISIRYCNTYRGQLLAHLYALLSSQTLYVILHYLLLNGELK